MPSLISITFALKNRSYDQLALLKSLSSFLNTQSDWDHVIVLCSKDTQHPVNHSFSKCKIVEIPLPDRSAEPPSPQTGLNEHRWTRFADFRISALFHYELQEPPDSYREKSWWTDYQSLNTRTCDVIADVYQAGDVVWIHDVAFLLLPRMLRDRLDEPRVGFSLHTPFPCAEVFRCLSQREVLLHGLLGADMIGFQNDAYLKHFSSCCVRLLSLMSRDASVQIHDRVVTLQTIPVSVDVADIEASAFNNPVLERKLDELRNAFLGKRVIFASDVKDLAFGVVQRLKAFQDFLEMYPEWRDCVVLIQLLDSTPAEEKRNEQHYRRINELVAHINNTYGSLGNTIVHYRSQNVVKEEYLALMRLADVGLLTAIRGVPCNTPLEYVVCQRESHSPLIISELSGIATTLGQALQINPWDFAATAEAIKGALEMSDIERKARHAELLELVKSNSAQACASNFLESLTSSDRQLPSHPEAKPLDQSMIVEKYRKTSRRIFLMDYDGTLTPIVKDPAAALPSASLLQSLSDLAAAPGNEVWIVSGRDQCFLERELGHVHGLGLIAEHGSFTRDPDDCTWTNLADGADLSWQKEAEAVFDSFVAQTPGAWTEHKKAALTWHYRLANEEHGLQQARKCKQALLERFALNQEVQIVEGKKTVEIRPRYYNKGAVVEMMLSKSKMGMGLPSFVLCAGDDVTDEDMFRAVNRLVHPQANFSCKVGGPMDETSAEWRLSGPEDVLCVLAALALAGVGKPESVEPTP